jgi:hypothetical protein
VQGRDITSGSNTTASWEPRSHELRDTQTRRWAGAATPTQRNTTHALDRARRASDVINISNYSSNDNPPGAAQATLTRPVTAAEAADHAGGRPSGGRIGRILGWLVAVPRRCGDRWFAMNDAEADRYGWQMTRIHAGLGRRYRDPRFGALAGCAWCRGAGLIAEALCVPCSGTGRVTIRGVS